MKILELEECNSTELPSKPDGIYWADGCMVASVISGRVMYLSMLPNYRGMTKAEFDRLNGPTTTQEISEDFALKALAITAGRPADVLKVL